MSMMGSQCSLGQNTLHSSSSSLTSSGLGHALLEFAVMFAAMHGRRLCGFGGGFMRMEIMLGLGWGGSSSMSAMTSCIPPLYS